LYSSRGCSSHFVRFWLIEHNRVDDFISHMIATFSWHRFVAIQLWILVLFLVFVMASELNHLFGRGELPRLLFTHRPSELQLNRRERIRELARLVRLTDAHSLEEFRDPASAQMQTHDSPPTGSIQQAASTCS
jgi:hypothetical protein